MPQPSKEDRIARLERQCIALLSICATILDALRHTAIGRPGDGLQQRADAETRILWLSEEIGQELLSRDELRGEDAWSERLRVHVDRLRARESATRNGGT